MTAGLVLLLPYIAQAHGISGGETHQRRWQDSHMPLSHTAPYPPALAALCVRG